MTITATFQEAKSDVLAFMQAGIPVSVMGPAGTGKSDMFREIAAESGLPLIDWRATLRDAVDVRGLPVPDMATGRTRWLSPDDLPNAERDGPRGILFFDELPQAMPAVQTALFGLILDRVVGEYRLPDGWMIAAAGNLTTENAGSNGLLRPLANRFAHVEFGIDTTGGEWSAWAVRAGLHPALIAFVRLRASQGYLHNPPTGPAGRTVLAFPTPRSVARVSRFVAETDPRARFRRIRALVGESWALAFESFLPVWQRLPGLASIVADPDGAAVPGAAEPALCYAVAGMLARAVKPATMGPVAAYVSRLPAEFRAVFYTEATRRDASLKDTAAYVAWCIESQSVTL